jgi:hypothetical protein
MTKMLAVLSAIFLFWIIVLPGPADAAQRTANGIKNPDTYELSAQRRYARRYYGRRHYYRPYYYGPYSYRPYYYGPRYYRPYGYYRPYRHYGPLFPFFPFLW